MFNFRSEKRKETFYSSIHDNYGTKYSSKETKATDTTVMLHLSFTEIY